VKGTLLVVLALASAFASAQSVTKGEAIAALERGQQTVAALNAEARDVSKKIGELAISGKLASDPTALDEMKRLVAALEEVNARLATLEASIAELREWAAGKDKSDAAIAKAVGDTAKITFAHYFQTQYRDTDQEGKTQHSFEVRRFRFGATMQINEQATAKVSFDMAGGTNRSAAELKDVLLMYRPIGSQGLTITAGQFVAPFGYETPTSSSSIELPERVAYNKTLFNDERLRGVMVEQQFEGGFSVYGGVSNALTTKDAEQASLAPGAGARLAGFAGVKYKAGDAQYGLGYFAGTRPEYTSGGTSPEVDRRFLYADAQVMNIMDTGLYFRGEVMSGQDRVPSSTGDPLNVATDMTGYIALLGYEMQGGHALFTRYSVFDSDTDVDGDAVSELGFGYRHGLGSGASLTLAHEIFRDPSVANSPYRVTTLRLQFKF
jgi:hypothetical protein